MALLTGTATGSFTDPINGGPARGSVIFEPDIEFLTDLDNTIIGVGTPREFPLSALGAFTAVLPATNDPFNTPYNWTYTVRFNIENLPHVAFSMPLPSGVITNLATVIQMAPFQSGLSPFILLDDTVTPAALTTLSAALTAQGGGVVHFQPGVYNINASVLLTDNVTFNFSSGAIIECDTAAPAFHAAGVLGNLTALSVNQVAGAYTITLPAGQGANFAANDIIGLQASTTAAVVIPGTPGGRAREIHQVISVAGNILTIDGPLEWDYFAVDNSSFFKITPKHDIHITGNPTFRWKVGGTKGRGIVFDYILRGTINMTAVAGPGVTVTDSIGIDTHCVIDSPGVFTVPLGYGIVVAGASRACEVSGRGRDCRHWFTTLPLDIAPNMWTGPYDTHIHDSYAGNAQTGANGFAPYDTHAYAVRTHFDVPRGHGPGAVGVPVLQDRGYRTQVTEPDLYGGMRGLVWTADSVEGRCDGGRVAIRPSSSESAVVIAGSKIEMIDTDVEALIGTGIDTISDSLVQGGVIRAFVPTRENAGVDTGAIFKDLVVHMPNAPAYAHLTAWGRYINIDYVKTGTSTIVFQSQGATARMEHDWHPTLTVTFAAAVTPNPALNNQIEILLTGNTTINNPAVGSEVIGNRLRVIFIQDGTGGRTVIWGTEFRVNWTPNTAANLRNTIDFVRDGTDWVQVSQGIGLV